MQKSQTAALSQVLVPNYNLRLVVGSVFSDEQLGERPCHFDFLPSEVCSPFPPPPPVQ